jgi:hypothetical protein
VMSSGFDDLGPDEAVVRYRSIGPHKLTGYLVERLVLPLRGMGTLPLGGGAPCGVRSDDGGAPVPQWGEPSRGRAAAWSTPCAPVRSASLEAECAVACWDARILDGGRHRDRPSFKECVVSAPIARLAVFCRQLTRAGAPAFAHDAGPPEVVAWHSPCIRQP